MQCLPYPLSVQLSRGFHSGRPDEEGSKEHLFVNKKKTVVQDRVKCYWYNKPALLAKREKKIYINIQYMYESHINIIELQKEAQSRLCCASA